MFLNPLRFVPERIVALLLLSLLLVLHASSSPTSARPSSSGASKKQSYYSLLGVTPHTDTKEIKKIYIKLARLYHPDKNEDVETRELFSRVNRGPIRSHPNSNT